MRKLHLLFIILLCLSSLCSHAQESTSRKIFNQAESEYNIGRVEQAIQLLTDNLGDFDGLLKQSAYRLLALCYLSEDRIEEARYYAGQLIKINNYYNSTDDPARFQDLVNQLKEGITTTITTASSQSETVNEAPVPITIISAEMIEQLGYNKNLGQILAAYVPGIAQVTNLEEGDNLSMHGAFSNVQEFMLILENGHRLNTRFDNSGPISYSISTEKIDHIEVLRGPASSLYGNVALSAVVNIITKSGRDLEAVKAKYGHGSFNTHKADITIGTQFMDADIYAWASIYNSDGQTRNIRDGEAYLLRSFIYKPEEQDPQSKTTYWDTGQIYVDGYKDKPAFDVGLSFKLKGFDLMFSKKNVKKVLQLTSLYGGYDYDRYYSINGIKPGSSAESTHLGLGYTRQFKKIFLNASLYSDWYNNSSYEVLYDSCTVITKILDPEGETFLDENGIVQTDTTINIGHFSYNLYNEHTIGGHVRASSDYRLGEMKGNLLVGCQYENFSLRSVNKLWGESFGWLYGGNLAHDEITRFSQESNFSFFVQDKHFFLPRLILNAGFRYDLKHRKEEDVVKAFSPRLALLYVPNDRFSLKLSYSEAYSDLSVYNRYIMKTEFSTLNPQHLSTVQLTAMGTIPAFHLKYEANIFYNKYTNLLNYLERVDFKGDNTGQLTNFGIEGTAIYSYKRFSTFLTLYYCHDISSKDYYYNYTKKMVCDVPHFTLNIHPSLQLLQGKTHEFKIYGHSTYTGKMLNYQTTEDEDFFVDGKLLFDLGIMYRYKQRLQLSLDCENIFDTYHYLCGPNYQYIPHIQRGRTLMASISYQF